MWNRTKTRGVLLATVGVLLARGDLFFQPTEAVLFALRATGILLAFAGIAVYASGMHRELKRMKACPACYTQNDAAAPVCRKCKKPISEKEDGC